jgi:hypothetical protein
VLESLVKSKRYALPLVSVAILHPYFGGSLALAWVEGARFDPRRFRETAQVRTDPASIAAELQSKATAPVAGSE